jgi:ADP-heptose:LPS heptosyltransferase
LICPDGGISHLAAAVNAPTLTLFFETDPQVWHHPGRNQYYIYTPDGAASLQAETVADKVYEIIKITSPGLKRSFK